MSYRLCVVAVMCGLAAACSVHEHKTVVVPPASDDACVSYGFTPGTAQYQRCVAREADARRGGRMAAAYGDNRIVADAQDACYSYGVARGTERYDRCVQREVAARRPL